MTSFKNKPVVFTVFALSFFAMVFATAHAAVTVMSAIVTGPSTVTIVYSEPVTTNPSDYSNFTGSLSGQTLAGILGSGTNTVTLNLSGTPMPPGSSGYVTIGANVLGVNDNSYLGGGTYLATDGQTSASATANATTTASSEAASGTSAVSASGTIGFASSSPEVAATPTLAPAVFASGTIGIASSGPEVAAMPTSAPAVSGTSSMDAALELKVLQSQLAKLQLQQTNSGVASAVPSPYKFKTLLRIGSSGVAVTALQKLLTRLDFYAGPVNGKYGALTAAAVKKYQSAHGVTAKGYVGPGTRALLNKGK
jgi:hypothetical protein